MGSFKHLLRRAVEALDLKLLVQFGLYKLPVTVLSFFSLWALRIMLGEMFWAAWINSIMTQVIEFMVLRSKVFKPNGWSGRLVANQFVKFWGWAFVVGLVESWALANLEELGFMYAAVYIIGHIPTFFLRFFGDRLIFKK